MAPFCQRIAAVARLKPLDAEQTVEYIRAQINRAGGSADSIFTAGALSELYERSGGVPRRINQLCHRTLLLAYAHESGMADTPYVQAAAEQIFLDQEQHDDIIEPLHSHHVSATYERVLTDPLVEEPSPPEEQPMVVEVGAGCPNASQMITSEPSVSATPTERPATQPPQTHEPEPIETIASSEDIDRRVASRMRQLYSRR